MAVGCSCFQSDWGSVMGCCSPVSKYPDSFEPWAQKRVSVSCSQVERTTDENAGAGLEPTQIKIMRFTRHVNFILVM